MPRDLPRILATLLLAVAQVVVAWASGAGYIGPTIGDLSDQTRSLIVPAGYAFSIWGVLYLGSIAYALYQALPAHHRDPLLRKIGWPASVAFLATTLWIPVFSNGWFILSNVIILADLLSLAVVVRRMLPQRRSLHGLRLVILYGNFSLFLGWVAIASAANLAQTAVAKGWFTTPAAHLFGGLTLLSVAGLSATLALWRMRGNLPFITSLCWALLAITIAHWTDARTVSIVAFLFIAILIGTHVFAVANRRNF